MKQEEGGENSNFQIKTLERPSLYYGIGEVYTIRKESINHSNDQIYKRLSKQFQRIKKIRSEPNGNNIIAAQYDYDNCPTRKDFKRLREIYNQVSKSNIITKRRIDKMRNKVDLIKTAVEKDEYTSVKEVDVNKMLNKGGPQQQTPLQGINSNNSKTKL